MDRHSNTVKLSIIMPTHNRADVISFAIKSVLYQNFRDYELLIVGDGCTDQTAEVVKSFADSRIRWLDLPKAPHYGYANRNIAFKLAEGEYIGFMAHDDIILPDHFQKLIAVLDGNPQLELVYSRPGWVTRDGLIFAVEFNLLNHSTRIAFLQRRHNALPASWVVHRKFCFEKYGYWNSDLPSCGDWDMWIRIISGEALNFDFVPVVTCLHFVAIWKQDINSGLGEARHWRILYESELEIPAILRHEILPNISEQETIWTELQRDPIGWSQELRMAMVRVTDLRISTLVSQNTDLQRGLDQLKKNQEQTVKEANINEDLTSIRDVLEKLAQSNQEQRIGEIKVNQDLARIIHFYKQLEELNQDFRQEIIDLKFQFFHSQDNHKQKEIEQLNNQLNAFKKNREDIYHSYSWKIGRAITKSIDFLFGWVVK